VFTARCGLNVYIQFKSKLDFKGFILRNTNIIMKLCVGIHTARTLYAARNTQAGVQRVLTVLGMDLPQRRHCHDGVPECSWNGSEVRIIHILLGIEHDSSEDNDSHGERENEEA